MDAKFIGKAKLTVQGQLTLPQEARQDLKIDPKSEVYWYEFNEVLILVKELVNPKELIEKFFGLKPKNFSNVKREKIHKKKILSQR